MPDVIPQTEILTAASNSGYYVTATDAGNYWRLAGPYDNHADALAAVDTVHDICIKHNPYSWFYAFGTSKLAGRAPGSLNRNGLI